MNRPRINYRARHVVRLRSVAAWRGVALIIIAWSPVPSCAPGDAAPKREPGNGLTVSVAVERFIAIDSAPMGWIPAAFAESVTVRLAMMRGLHAHVANGTSQESPDFLLRGDVKVRDGRVVIAAHLWRPGEDKPVWTGTFWRADGPIHDVLPDVATGVAEALYADIARRALMTKEREKS